MMENFEEQVCMNFTFKFINNYEDCCVAFHIQSLSDAIKEACFKEPASLRRTLLLYFHEDDDAFSKQFCLLLKDESIQRVIGDSFYVVAWDIGYEYNNTSHRLKDLLAQHFYEGLDLMRDFISNRKSGVFLIRTLSNVLTVNASISGSITKSLLLSKLREVEKTMKNDYEIENQLGQLALKNCEDQIGSLEFQKIMFDQLGDRDYDCFESSEHEYLKDKIGFALYGPPTDIKGYSDEQKKAIDVLYKKICFINDEFSKWDGRIVISFIYNCTEPLPEMKLDRAKKYDDYNPLTDIRPVPIFVLRKCKGIENACRVFIDTDCRVYKSWSEYLTQNKLPKCKMVLPLNGKYQGQSSVELEKHFSPACDLSVAILKGADIATTVAALGSGGVFVAAMIPALTVAPIALTVAAVTGAGVGIYSIVRSSITLHDRRLRRQSMSFGNSEARGAYINIVAGSLGFVGAGATTIVSQLTSRGINIGQGARMALNTINGANIAAGGVGVANATYEVAYQLIIERQTPSALTILQLSSSILFFGNAVYNFKTAGVIIEESQTKVLNEFQDSLRSNRHRKTFNKLLKETVRLNGDSQGKAEVIASIRKMNQVDDVMAILTRSNRNFNRDGVRFASKGGKIQFNGVDVDVLEYGSMKQTSQSNLHIELPSIPDSVTQTEKNQVYSKIKDVFLVCQLEDIVVCGYRLITNQSNFKEEIVQLLFRFTGPIQEKLIAMSKTLTEKLADNFDWFRVLNEIFPKHCPFVVIMRFIVNFITDKVNQFENEYQCVKQEAQKDPGFNENKFYALYRFNPVTAKRLMQFFENCVLLFTSSTEQIINDLMTGFYKWLYEQILTYQLKIEKDRERRNNQKNDRKKTACCVCKGYYFKKA